MSFFVIFYFLFFTEFIENSSEMEQEEDFQSTLKYVE